MSVPLRPSASEWHQAWLADHHVDFSANTLTRAGVTQRLTPKACAVLRELCWRDNRVVRRDDLLGLVWPDSFPTDDVLTRAIRELRAALDDNPRAPTKIETIPRVGYRLNMAVRFTPPPEEATVASMAAASTDNEAPTLATAPSNDAPSTPTQVREPIRERPAPTLVARQLAWGLFAVLALAWGGREWLRARDLDIATATITPGTIEPLALTADPGTEYFPAISPDGALIAYVGAADGELDAALMLKARDPDARAVTLVPATPNAFMAHLIWSPDGTRIAYAQLSEAGCELCAVAVTGGTPRAIAPCNVSVMDAFDWAPDGQAIYMSEPRDGEAAGARGLVVIDLATGTRRALDYGPRAPGDVDLYPRISPDGRWLAFRRGVRPYADIWVMPIAGGTAREVARLGSGQQGMAWLPDSRGLVVSSDHAGTQALYRVDIDSGAVRALGIDQASYPAIARRSGMAVFFRNLQLTQLVAFDLDAQGRAGPGRVIAPASRSDYSMSLSRRGRRLAFVSERSGTSQIWTYDFDNDHLAMLTHVSNASPDYPEWSPDERQLLYIRRGRGTSELVRVDLDSAREQVLSATDERVRFGSWSNDGQTIFYASDRGQGWRLWRMRADGGDARPLHDLRGLDPRQFDGDPRLYYGKLNLRGLFRADLETGIEEAVSGHVTQIARGGFRVVGDRLWLYERTGADTGGVFARALTGGTEGDDAIEKLGELRSDGLHPLPMASFDATARRIVVNMVARDGSDLYLAPLQDTTSSARAAR